MMMYNETVKAILEIIEYTDDKEAFVADFNRIINGHALIALMQTLPADKQNEADSAIAKAKSPETFTETVHKYFSDAQVRDALDKAAVKAITEWIASIAPTLKEEQRTQLVDLGNTLQKNMKL